MVIRMLAQFGDILQSTYKSYYFHTITLEPEFKFLDIYNFSNGSLKSVTRANPKASVRYSFK